MDRGEKVTKFEKVTIHLIYLFQDFYCPNKIDLSPEISSSCIQRIPSQQWTIIYILNKFWCVPSNILRNIEWNTGAPNPSRIANIPLLMYISTVVLGTIFLCYLRQDNPVGISFEICKNTSQSPSLSWWKTHRSDTDNWYVKRITWKIWKIKIIPKIYSIAILEICGHSAIDYIV